VQSGLGPSLTWSSTTKAVADVRSHSCVDWARQCFVWAGGCHPIKVDPRVDLVRPVTPPATMIARSGMAQLHHLGAAFGPVPTNCSDSLNASFFTNLKLRVGRRSAPVLTKFWSSSIMYGIVADSGLACATNLCCVHDVQCARF